MSAAGRVESRLGTARPWLAACVLALLDIGAYASNTLVPEGIVRYAPSAFPDRILALPAQDPATGLTVAWRTHAAVSAPLLQIVEARSSPDLAHGAREVRAQSEKLISENGVARHHHARIEGLTPDTLYAYRVQGHDTWSEWFQIRTAAREARAFSFLYFGDAQNSVKSLYSRVIRAAWRHEPRAALTIHAGDLVNGRAGRNDTEWGEWFDAGGFILSSSLTVAAPGNHEHDDNERGGRGIYSLGAHWPAQFPGPRNGAPGLPHTTYSFDYQGVRFIVLDSTSALKGESGSVQAKWLERLLARNSNRWTVVVYHHPIVSVSLGRDNPPLRHHWMPLLERYDVDLVLQGHDHVYGRGANFDALYRRAENEIGPVYVVSVAGPKQYRVSKEARSSMTRAAENTQLYQIVHVDAASLRYESWTVTGELYDAFTLEKRSGAAKRLFEHAIEVPSRRCPHARSGSGREERCWDGTEW